MQNKQKLFAITGGIGSGKSTATLALREAGYNTLSCDEVTHSLHQKRQIKKQLKKIFPTAVKGIFCLKTDKSEIARIVFNDPAKYVALTELLTVRTMEETFKLAKKMKGDVFIETPLLFENGYEGSFDGVIVVARALEDRKKSTLARPNMTEEQFYARVLKQIDYDKFDFKSAYVLINDGTEEELKSKILSLAKTLTTD